MSCKLEHALSLARRGFYVFPLEPNGKKPLIKWRDGSTRDEAVIKGWYKTSEPNIGVDCGKSGLCVVDVDEKIDSVTGRKKTGKKSIADLEEQNCLFPDTYMVETPTGGLHLYYSAEGLSNSAGTFAKDIDIRAEGGYVVSPFSCIDGEMYALVPPELPIVPLPLWAVELCEKTVPRDERKADISLSEDAPSDIDRAIDFLKSYPEAVQGAGGDHHTYTLFCHLKERGLSMHQAIDLVMDHWNERCSPPWGIEELTIKAENAYAYAHNATGAKSPEYEFSDTQIIKPKEATISPTDLYHRSSHPDALSIPKRKWVFGDLALRKQLSVLIAPGGTGKSTFTIGMALSKASGKSFMGMDPRGVGRVLIYNNEDNLDEVYRRETAMRQFLGLTNADLCDSEGSRVFYGTGDQHMLRVIKKTKEGSLIIEKDVEAITAQIIRDKIDLVVIDPLAQTHNVDENDNGQMLRVGEVFLGIAQQANCSTMLVHHTRKRDKAATDGHSGNMDSLRGASSVASLARIVATLDVMSNDTAKRLLGKSNMESRYKYVEFMMAKANMSVVNRNTTVYEKIGEKIGMSDEDPDGEEVGVLKHVVLCAPEQNINADDRELLEAAALLVSSPVKLNDLTKLLVKSVAWHGDNKAASVSRRITTLFGSKDDITLMNGILSRKRDTLDGRGAWVLSYEKFEDEIIDVEDLL